jgi:hypothetical protein
VARQRWKLTFNERTGRYKLAHPVGRYPNRYDGFIIYETKDCAGCSFFIEADADQGDIVGVCVKGVAWKAVYRVAKKRKCIKLEGGGRVEG